MFGVISCGGGGSSSPSDLNQNTEVLDSPVTFTSGQVQLATRVTADRDGGSYRVVDVGSAINNFELGVPAALLEQSAEFALYADDGTLVPNSGVFTGQTFVLETPDLAQYMQPVSIDVPVDPARGTPLLYRVEADGSLEFVRRGALDAQRGLQRFLLYHPGRYTVITRGDTAQRAARGFAARTAQAPTDFQPAVDGFQIDNDGSAVNLTGECHGMVAFARWFYLNYKQAAGSGLYPRYLCTVTETDAQGTITLLTGQNLVATRSFISLSQHWDEYIEQDNALVYDDFVTLFDALANTRKPVLIYLAGQDDAGKGIAHAVLAISADSASGVVDIYDPNHHGEVKQLTFAGVDGNRSFAPYGPFTQVAVMGGTPPMQEPFEKIVVDAEGHFGAGGFAAGEDCPPLAGTTLAQVRVLSHNRGDSVASRVVTLSGDVDSNAVLAERIRVKVGSQVFGPFDLTPGLFGFDTFEVPIVLRRGENRIRLVTEGRDSEGKYVKVVNNLDMTDDFVLNSTAPATVANLSLSWDREADIDLVVIAPDGDYSDFMHPLMAGGGQLVREDQVMGPENWVLEAGDSIIYDQPYRIRAHFYSAPTDPAPYTRLQARLRLYEDTPREREISYSDVLFSADAGNDNHLASGQDWADVGFFTLTREAAPAAAGVLDSTVTFYAGGSATPTGSDYVHDINLSPSDALQVFPQTGCFDMANTGNSFSTDCLLIRTEVPGQLAGKTVSLELRFSHLLSAGTFTLHPAEYSGDYAYVGIISRDLESRVQSASSRDTQGSLELVSFGVNPGDHVSGTLNVDLKGGTNDFGFIYGRYQAAFDFVMP
jgi:hypothetical protein